MRRDGTENRQSGVAAKRKTAKKEQAYVQTAETLVGNLQKFADDMNAALKAQALDMDIKIQASPWEQQMTSMVSTVYVSNCGHDHVINVDGRGLVSVSFRSPLRC
jgi:hypothetical protein